jgi:hypothetical protein
MPHGVCTVTTSSQKARPAEAERAEAASDGLGGVGLAVSGYWKSSPIRLDGGVIGTVRVNPMVIR